MTSWSGCGYGNGAGSVAHTTLKMAVFDPMPSASAAIAGNAFSREGALEANIRAKIRARCRRRTYSADQVVETTDRKDSESVGFVHLRAFGATADLIASVRQPSRGDESSIGLPTEARSPFTRAKGGGKGGIRTNHDLLDSVRQIPRCHGCRECQRCRGALHALARTAEVSIGTWIRFSAGHGRRPCRAAT